MWHGYKWRQVRWVWLWLLLGGPAFAAFTGAAKNYSLRTNGVVRTFLISDTAGSTGTTNSVYITSPTAIYVEMFAGVSGWNGGTVLLEYSADNGVTAFAVLTTATVSCTADCVKFVAAADVKSGYYRVNHSVAGAGAYQIVVNITAVGAVDVQ